jgi:hypothetical protein
MSEGLGPVGTKNSLNITSAQLLDTTGPSSYSTRRVSHVHVLVAGSTPGSVNDAATVAAAGTANLVFAIPNTVGIYVVDFPCMQGIVVTPGTGQTVAVSYD